MQSPKIFAYLTPDELNKVKEYFITLFFSERESIIKQGYFYKGIYIIKAGKASVITHTVSDASVMLAQLNEDNFFGETALFSNQPSSASVLAETDMEVYFLSNSVIQSFRILDPLLGYKIIKSITEITCLRIREKLGEICVILKKIKPNKARQFCAPIIMPVKDLENIIYPLKTRLNPDDPIFSAIFKDFTFLEIEILLSYMSLVEGHAKAILFRAEEIDVSCYFTLSGVVQRIVESGNFSSKLNICGPGRMVGQVDFSLDRERRLTAVLREKSQFLKLTASQKKHLEDNYPILWARLYYNIANEVVQMLYLTNQLLLRLMSETAHV